jgi:hypothetical protein
MSENKLSLNKIYKRERLDHYLTHLLSDRRSDVIFQRMDLRRSRYINWSRKRSRRIRWTEHVVQIKMVRNENKTIVWELELKGHKLGDTGINERVPLKRTLRKENLYTSVIWINTPQDGVQWQDLVKMGFIKNKEYKRIAEQLSASQRPIPSWR